MCVWIERSAQCPYLHADRPLDECGVEIYKLFLPKGAQIYIWGREVRGGKGGICIFTDVCPVRHHTHMGDSYIHCICCWIRSNTESVTVGPYAISDQVALVRSDRVCRFCEQQMVRFCKCCCLPSSVHHSVRGRCKLNGWLAIRSTPRVHVRAGQ